MANVFAENFAASDLYEGGDLGFIKRLFSTHLNTLKRTYKRQNLETPEEKAADQDVYQQSKHESRRRNVRTSGSPWTGNQLADVLQSFNRRKRACLNYPDLEKYAQVLANTGLFLISGDESNGDECSILKLNVLAIARDSTPPAGAGCRAPVLEVFSGKPTPGQWPNYRVEGARKDYLTRAPAGLPSNFYDARVVARDRGG